MFVQVGSFCASNQSSGIALHQDLIVCKVGSLMMIILAAVLAHPLFICSDHVWNQSYWTQEYLAFFLMKVFVKLFVNQLRLKETISWLRLNYREFMNWTNGRIIQCIMFGAWIQWIYKGLLWEGSGPSGNSLHSPGFSSAALKDVKPCLGILNVPRGINHDKHPRAAQMCTMLPVETIWTVGIVCSAGEGHVVCRGQRRRHYLWSRRRRRRRQHLASCRATRPDAALGTSMAASVTTATAVAGGSDIPNFPYSSLVAVR